MKNFTFIVLGLLFALNVNAETKKINNAKREKMRSDSNVVIEKRSKNFVGFSEGQTALSLFLGQPSIVRYDYWLHWRNVLFFDFGYHWDRYFYGGVSYAMYLFNTRDFLRKRDRSFWNSLLFYGGPGIFTGFASSQNADTSVKIGARLFGGVEYLFDGQKYAVRTEIAPAIFFQGQSSIGIQAMIGMTYYFGDRKKVEFLDVKDEKPQDAIEDDFDI